MQKKAFPNPQGKFTDLKALIDYEKAWHRLIYKPAKTNLKDEVDCIQNINGISMHVFITINFL